MRKVRKEVDPQKIAAKRRFREQLYKGPKQQLKEQNETKVIHAYKKVLRKEEKNLTKWQNKLEKIYAQGDEEEGTVTQQPSRVSSQPQEPKSWSVGKKHVQKKLSSLHKAEKNWKEKRENLTQKKMENQKIADEKKLALEKYGKNKKDGHKKRAKRNYKGQPIMASQVDLLLSKLQKNKS